MRAQIQSGRQSRLLSLVKRACTILITAACLVGAALPASAQTIPSLTGVSTGPATQTSPPHPLSGNMTQSMTLYQNGSAVTGNITTNWPGTAWFVIMSVSGTVSGTSLSATWTAHGYSLPPGLAPCGAGAHTLALATSGSVTTATIPGYSCAGAGPVNTATLSLVGWQKMYGTESGGCANCGPSVFYTGGSVDVATGNVLEPTTDYETAGPNKLSLIRYYNSYQTQTRLVTNFVYVVANVPNVTTNYDLGLSIIGTTQAIAYRADGQQLTFNLVSGVWTPDTDVDMALANPSGNTWTLTNHDDSVETYTVVPGIGGLPGTGRLNSIKARNGYTQTIAYNVSNQISTVTDSYSRQLTFTYTLGYLTSVATPDSLVLSYGYSSSTGGANDRLASVSYNTSPVTSQTYNYANASFPFNITSVTDENGNTFRTFTYDAYGRALTDQIGTGANANVTTITYNDSAATVTEKNALGQNVTYTFTTLQGANRPIEMARSATAWVAAATSKFTYDSNGFLATSIDWNGNTTTLTNNVHGDPTTVVEATGTAVARTTTIAYDPTWVHLPDTITTTGLTTGFTYDGNGNPLTQTLTDTTTQTIPYPTGGQTRTTNFTWSNFLPLTVQTPNGNTTTFTFGADGALTNISNALLQNTAITSHTGGGLPLTIVDPNSVTTTLTYSPRNWLLTSTVGTGAGPLTTTNTYDAAGNLTKVQQPDGSYLTNAYDTAHRLTSVTDSFGNSIDYTLDAMGDRTVSNIENPSSVVTRGHTADYDTLGRLLNDIGGMTQNTGYVHENNSNLHYFEPPSLVVNNAYDQLNRWITQTFGTGDLVTKTYDAHDRVLTVKDQIGNTTSYVYDGFGDVIQQASPDTGTTVFHYDADGNLTQKVDALSVATNYTYDALERMLTTAYPADTAENVAFTYDQTGAGFSFGIGRLTSLTDMAGSLTRAYDERGNLLTEKRTSGATVLTTSYTYDAASRVLTITYPDGSLLTYTRDAMGRITAVSDKPAGAGSPITVASSITYEPFGPWSGFTNGNGIAETPTWDADYRLTSLVDTGTVAVQHIGYTYNLTNQPSAYTDSLTSTNSISAIGYDALFHLTSFTNGGAKALTFDNNGNRKTLTGTTYSYAAGGDQLASLTTGGVTTTVTTNANGNITGFSPGFGTAAVTTLAYNNANRLTSVSSSGGTLGAYIYDAFGQRFSKTVGASTTLYQYSGGGLLAETTGGTETNYLYLNGRPLAMLAASTFTYLHDDKLGRPQAATDASQTVVWKASYLPFGETIATSGSFTQNLRFPGQYADAESGFSHNGFRDYVPSLGRYLEADPLGIYDNTGRLNAGMNPFLYVGADPMRSIDPWGLYWSNGTSCYTHQGQGGTIVPGFLCAIDRLITTLQNLESYTADTCGGAGGPMPGTQCSNYGLAPAAPALLELAALDTGLKTAIGEGGVPLAVVEENTIVLGLRNFDLQSTADQIGGSTLMTNGDWQVALQTALSNPNTNIVVSLDGVSGASTYSQFMSAAQQGIAAGPSASPFNWEMGQIYQAGRQGSVTFMRSGKVVPNPFQ